MIGTVTKMDALYSLAPTSKWSITGDVINWYDEDDTVPTDAELAAEITRLQGVYDNAEYQRTRAAAYPELKEQLDLLYHDMAADKGDKTGTWFAAVKAVKDATAKPE